MARKTRKEENAIRKKRYQALAARLLDIEIRVGNNLPISAEDRRLLNIRIERRQRELLRVQSIRCNRRNQRSVSGNQISQPISEPTTNTSLVETNRNDVQSHPQASVRRSGRNQRAMLPNINQPNINQQIPERTTHTSTVRRSMIDPPSSGKQNQMNQSTNTSTLSIQESAAQSPTNPSSSIQRRRSNRFNQSTDSSTTQISISLTNISNVRNQESGAHSPTNPSSSIQRRRSNRINQSTDSSTTQISNSLTNTSTVPIQESAAQSPTNPSSSIQRRRSNRTNQSTDSSTTQISNSLTNISNVLNQESAAHSPTNPSSSIQRRRSNRRRSNRTNQSADSTTTQISNSLSSTVARTPSSNLRIDNNEVPRLWSNTIFSDATFYVGERINVMCGYHFDQPHTGTIQRINLDNRTADIIFDTGPRREYTRSFIHMSHIDLDAGRPVRNNRLQIDQFNFESYNIPRSSARNRTLVSTSSLAEPSSNSAAPNVDEMDYTETLEYFGDGSENTSARRLLSTSDVDLFSDVICNVSEDLSGDDRKCSICQSEEWSVGQKRTVLPCCLKTLHFDCVEYWLTKHSSQCHLCRYPLSEFIKRSGDE